MGLAASQARLLTLTSRLSDLELKQQSFANMKMRMAAQSDAVSSKYSESLNNKTLQISNNGNFTNFAYDSLSALNMRVKRASDGLVPSNESKDSTGAAKDLYNQLQNPQFLIQGILSGYLTLEGKGSDNVYSQINLSTNKDLVEVYDKSDDAAAEAEYKTEINKINRKEKMIDQQMSGVETEHSAVKADYESVSSIIKEHTDKDFQMFA